MQMTTYAVENASHADPHVLKPGDSGAPGGGWVSPRKGFLFFLGFAAIGAGMASLVPAVLTLSLKARGPGGAGSCSSSVWPRSRRTRRST
jgi:hypothetical protein